MKILIHADGRLFNGSPMDILLEMRARAFREPQETIGEYVRWLEGETGLKLAPPKDESDVEAAATTIAAFERAGLVEVIDDGVAEGA